MGDQPMEATTVGSSAGPVRVAILWTLGLHAVTVVAALAVSAVPAAGTAMQQALQLTFEARHGTLREAADILFANARAVGTIVLLAVAVRCELASRTAALLVTGVLAGANAAIVGSAVGAYGIVMTAAWLAHLPLEWTALGVAAAAVAMPAGRLSAVCAGAVAFGCLLAASLVETYATPLAFGEFVGSLWS